MGGEISWFDSGCEHTSAPKWCQTRFIRQTKAGNGQSPIPHLPNVAQVLQKIFDQRLHADSRYGVVAGKFIGRKQICLTRQQQFLRYRSLLP